MMTMIRWFASRMPRSITKDQKKTWSILNLPHNQRCCQNLSQKHTQSPIENLGFCQTSRTVKKNSHVSSLRKGRALSQISMTHFFNDSLCAGNLILQEAGPDMLLFVDVSNEKLESSKAQVKWSLVKTTMQNFSLLLPFKTSVQDMRKIQWFFKTLPSPGSWEILLLLRHFFLKFSAQLWTRGFHPKCTGSK